jgi:hypothetical protein
LGETPGRGGRDRGGAPESRKFLKEPVLHPEHATTAASRRPDSPPVARREPARALRAAAAGAALAAAVLVGLPAKAASPRSGSASQTATAVAKARCVGCHEVPAPGSGRTRGWASASINMHVRRVALPASEWALVREYLGLPPARRGR